MEQKRKNTFASYFIKKNNSCEKLIKIDDHTKVRMTKLYSIFFS